jgi:hypothetical protein
MRFLYAMTSVDLLDSLKNLGLAKFSPNWSTFFRKTRFQEDADDAKNFHGKYYYQITLQDLIECPDFFYRLSPVGFQYYLLAVIKITLENQTCGYLNVIDNVLIGLQDIGPRRQTPLFKEWWGFFDKAEFILVVEWLKLYGEILFSNRSHFTEEIEAIEKLNLDEDSYKYGES